MSVTIAHMRTTFFVEIIKKIHYAVLDVLILLILLFLPHCLLRAYFCVIHPLLHFFNPLFLPLLFIFLCLLLSKGLL
jgi:hypothetical protein